MSEFKPGDHVAYSVQFLKSIFEPPTSPMCHARGTITEVKQFGCSKIASVEWDPGHEFPGKVNTCNLAHVEPNSKFCNCD